MKMDNSGLTFRKIDLHVHTPASKCFDDKTVTPEQIVETALDKGLEAIAITDHNTGEWIDKIKQAAKNKLVIFPGVEISAPGGKRSVHIIGIFDQSKTTKDIENLLGALGIRADQYGKEDALSKCSPNQVINKIAEHGGLPVLAHANSDLGVMGGMKGNQRIEILQNPNLAAVESTDYYDQHKRIKKKRVIDILRDPNSGYRKLAVYQASDNPSSIKDGKHSLDGIGKRFTYFKLDEITLEGLRQCFCDPDVRIRQQNDLESTKYPKIIKLEISEGFLKGQKITFHAGLNSIVGGKGVGKSLLIELLRFALNQASKDESIKKDHSDKLKKRLGPFGKVFVEFELANGERYKIERTYDGNENPFKCINLSTNETYEGEISSLFPILAYSQNEVIKIAEDENAQLRLIDSFINTESYKAEIRRIKNELLKSDQELAKSLKASSEVASYQIELNTVDEKIKNINKDLSHPLFEEMKKWEEKKRKIEDFLGFHNELIEKIDQFLSEFENQITKPEIPKDLNDDPELERISKISSRSLNKLHDLLNSAKAEVSNNKVKIENIRNAWNPEFDQLKEEYEEMIEKAGGDRKKLESERRKLLSRKQTIENELNKYTKQLEKLDEIKKKRNSLLDDLERVYKEYYKARKNKFENLTNLSNGKLKLELTHASNREQFKKKLLSLKEGSHIREVDIEKIINNIFPREFVDLIIEKDIDSLAKKANIARENAEKLINFLNAKEALEEVLMLSHNAYPEDVPSIKYKKEDGKHYPLSELSVGQKCTALLIVALSEGDRPIIIDQPEDSLDNPSVYEDIVSKLRAGKEKRQFILTTHNSSVGVASDSDNFIVFRSTSDHGEIKCIGAIDRNNVRKEIIKHLEGGEVPYGLRSKKYNIKRID